MELETDDSLNKEDSDALACALTDIAIAAREGCTTWGEAATVLNDIEHAVENLRAVITALIAEQHNSNK
jgi:hypothetical protein